MENNTHMKEIYAEVKKNVEDIAHVNEIMQSQMEHLKAANQAQIEQMDVIHMTSVSMA